MDWKKWGQPIRFEHQGEVLELQLYVRNEGVHTAETRVGVFGPDNEHLFCIEAPQGNAEANHQRLLTQAKRMISESAWQAERAECYVLTPEERS